MTGEVEVRLPNGSKMLLLGEVDVQLCSETEQRENDPRNLGIGMWSNPGGKYRTVTVRTVTITVKSEEP